MIKILLISLLVAGAADHLVQPADSSYSKVRVGAAASSGDFHNVYDGASFFSGGAEAEARRTIGNVLLYGNFRYGGEYATSSRSRGWVDPYETPFMLCDTIPGTTYTEIYDMQALAAVRRGHWLFGADLAYTNTEFAKRKDLRNKNVRMDFSAAPLVGWEGEGLRAILRAGFALNSERVEFTQIDASGEKYLFDIQGLWLSTVSGYSSAENRRQKLGGKVFSNLSLDWKAGSALHLSSESRLGYGTSTQTETGYNNLHYGDTRSFEAEEVLGVSFNGRHHFRAGISLSQLQGLRPVQRQELDPDSKIRRWYSYGDLSEVFWREVVQTSVSYNYVSSEWSFSAGVSALSANQSAKEYPLVFSQSLSYLTPFAGAGFILPLGEGKALTLSPTLSARIFGSGEMDGRKVYGSMTLEDGGERPLEALMEEEFSFWSASSGSAALRADYSLPLSGERNLIISLSGKGTLCLTGAMKNKTRTTLALSATYNF